MSNLQPTRFDYSVVDDDTRRKLISCAGDVNRSKKSALAGMIEMGEAIDTAQELLANNGNGVFNAWIEAECGISHQSAHNYMRAFRAFGDCKSLLQSFTQEAMYLLAAPKTPEAAVKKALKSAENGIKVTETVAKQIIKAVQPPREDPPRNQTPKTGSEQVSTEKTNTEPAGPPEAIEDAVGQPVPDKLIEVFAACEEFADQHKAIAAVKKWGERISATKAGVYLHLQSFLATLTEAQKQLKFERPHAVCPYCLAKKQNCEACKGRGFVKRGIYDSAPSELRV